MTELAVAVRTHAANDAGVKAIFGDRLYPLVLPEGVTMPAATFQRIDSPPLGESHDEATNPSLSQPRIQWDVYADDTATESGFDIVQAGATAIRRCFRGFVGLLGGTNRASCRAIQNQMSDRDPVTGRWRETVDTLLTTREDS